MPCVFCKSDDKLTREHLAPQWLRSPFPDEGTVPHMRIWQEQEVNDRRDDWEAIPFDITKRIVCQSCNGGWMSRMEAEIKPLLTPMILDKRIGLNIEQQAKVATWATKTSLMLQHTHPDGQVTMPPAAYEYVYRHQLPPANECVFLLRYDGEDQWPLSYHHVGIKFARPGAPEPDEVNGHGVVFAVGHLGFHLFGHHIEENPLARCSSKDRSVCIWPGNGMPVTWPPERSYRNAEELREAASQTPK